jgi:hypothetical protein
MTKTKPWFRRQPQLAEGIGRDLEKRYPDLRFVEEGDTAYIRGSFPITHEGCILARYQIEIEFPSDYPRQLPRVRETQGRIPRFLDRHVLPTTGTACLCVDEDWLLAAGPQPSFLDFLDGPVRNFFIGQALVEAAQAWPFGERSHGIKGLLEAYGEWFGAQDEATILRYLECLSREGIKGHWECPCGSREKLRKCHMEEGRALRKRIPQRLAKRALERLRLARRLEPKT